VGVGDCVDVGLVVAKLDEDKLCIPVGVRAAVNEPDPDIAAVALPDRLNGVAEAVAEGVGDGGPDWDEDKELVVDPEGVPV